MSDVVFQGYKVEKFEFVNIMQNGSQIKLEHKYSYNVKYASESKDGCKSELIVEVKDKTNPDSFKVCLSLIGFFLYDEKVSREHIHVLTFKELFPYARSIVTTLTANAGIPPIILPTVEMNEENVLSASFGKN